MYMRSCQKRIPLQTYQIFEGVGIARKVRDTRMYTVRKISNSVGVERTFPYTPRVRKTELARYGDTSCEIVLPSCIARKAARIKEVVVQDEQGRRSTGVISFFYQSIVQWI